MMMCGVDETGRGPMIGPLVVGAVWCEDDSVLREIGVKDSKQLTPKAREKMYSEISSRVPYWEVVIMGAEELDRHMANKNLNQVEMRMFAEAILRHPSDIVYVDCPEINTKRFGNEMSWMTGGRKVSAENKADALFPTVSAASIMAKVTRDRIIEDIEMEFGCSIGSGYPSDPATRAFVEKWIKDNGSAPFHTRKSWKPVRDMMSKRKMTSLDNLMIEMTMESQIQRLIDRANEKMAEDKKMRADVEKLKKTFNINLGEERYSFKLENAVISDFKTETVPEADVVLTSTPEILQKLLNNDIRPMRAYVTKKITIKGKIQDLMVLKKFF